MAGNPLTCEKRKKKHMKPKLLCIISVSPHAPSRRRLLRKKNPEGQGRRDVTYLFGLPDTRICGDHVDVFRPGNRRGRHARRANDTTLCPDNESRRPAVHAGFGLEHACAAGAAEASKIRDSKWPPRLRRLLGRRRPASRFQIHGPSGRRTSSPYETRTTCWNPFLAKRPSHIYYALVRNCSPVLSTLRRTAMAYGGEAGRQIAE